MNRHKHAVVVSIVALVVSMGAVAQNPAICTQKNVDEASTLEKINKIKDACTASIEAVTNPDPAVAVAPVAPATAAAKAADVAKKATFVEKLNSAAETKEKFLGLNWALGMAFTSLNKENLIKAVNDNGIVRVEASRRRTESLMLETHYTTGFDDDDSIADGPFIAIELADTEGESDGLKAYGFGWMWSFQYDKAVKKSVNIGAGYYVNKEIKALAAGYVDGQPLPAGTTEIKTREVDARGWMVMLSHTFW